MALILRGDVNRELTWAELDGNFTYLLGLVEALQNTLDLKADLVNGTVPLDQATPLYLSDTDFTGTGETDQDPVTII